MNLTSSWLVFALGAAFFAALTSIFGKLGVADLNSNLATFIRTVVIVVMIGAIVSWRGEWQMPGAVPTTTWLFLVLSGAATGLSWLCFYRALQLGPVSQVAPIDKLSVVLVALFGVIFLGEKLSGANWLGVTLIAAGAVLVAYRA